MSHIYLCYSNQDKELVDLIQDDLKERGYVVWRDTTHIAADQNWAEALDEALNSAYTVVVAASTQSLGSAVVQREFNCAAENDLPLVMVVLDSCDVPEAWRDTAVEVVSFVGVYKAGLEESGLEQLRQYRNAMHALTEALDRIYPVRIYLQELKHSNDHIREHAAKELGRLQDITATEALIETLSDPDADVRFAAATALGQLQSESAQRSLLRLLQNDEEADVRAATAVALGRIGDPSAIGPLIDQLVDSDRFVRAGVLEALGKLKATSAVNQIVHIMRNDPISDVRAAAQDALCHIGGPQAHRALQRAGVTCEESSL